MYAPPELIPFWWGKASSILRTNLDMKFSWEREIYKIWANIQN